MGGGADLVFTYTFREVEIKLNNVGDHFSTLFDIMSIVFLNCMLMLYAIFPLKMDFLF